MAWLLVGRLNAALVYEAEECSVVCGVVYTVAVAKLLEREWPL